MAAPGSAAEVAAEDPVARVAELEEQVRELKVDKIRLEADMIWLSKECETLRRTVSELSEENRLLNHRLSQMEPQPKVSPRVKSIQSLRQVLGGRGRKSSFEVAIGTRTITLRGVIQPLNETTTRANVSGAPYDQPCSPTPALPSPRGALKMINVTPLGSRPRRKASVAPLPPGTMIMPPPLENSSSLEGSSAPDVLSEASSDLEDSSSIVDLRRATEAAAAAAEAEPAPVLPAVELPAPPEDADYRRPETMDIGTLRLRSNGEESVHDVLRQAYSHATTTLHSLAERHPAVEAAGDSPVSVEIKENELIIAHVVVEKGTTRLVSGTIDKLVCSLADECNQDTLYIEDFLLTYRLFMDPVGLLSKLITRFNVHLPADATLSQKEYYDKWKRPIQLRTISVISKWIDRHWNDFQDPVLLDGLLDFLQLIQADFDVLYKHLKEKTDLKMNETAPVPPPMTDSIGSLCKSLNLLQLVGATNSKTVAEQLTLIEMDLFRAVPPVEFILQLDGGDNNETTPSITAYINRFNTVSYWAAWEICVEPSLDKRKTTIRKIVHVCQHLLHLRNFNTLMALISGLNLSPVSRLEKTWAKVDGSTRTTLRQLEALMSPADNYAAYRKLAATAKPTEPMIPFIGLFLKDLLFFHDGNASRVSADLVNIQKFRDMAARIFEQARLQSLSYDFERHPVVSGSLQRLPHVNEKIIYQCSTSVEPRAGAPAETKK